MYGVEWQGGPWHAPDSRLPFLGKCGVGDGARWSSFVARAYNGRLRLVSSLFCYRRSMPTGVIGRYSTSARFVTERCCWYMHLLPPHVRLTTQAPSLPYLKTKQDHGTKNRPSNDGIYFVYVIHPRAHLEPLDPTASSTIMYTVSSGCCQSVVAFGQQP